MTREGKWSYLEQIKTHKDNNNQKKETYKPNALKSIAYPSPSFLAKPNYGWSPVSLVTDLPKPGLTSQTRKPLLPVLESSGRVPPWPSVLWTLRCLWANHLPNGTSMPGTNPRRKAIPDVPSGTPRYVQQSQRDGNSYFWIPLTPRFPRDRANTRGSCCDPQQAGMTLHPELPFMSEKGSLHLSAQTVVHESTQLLFAGRWVFVFLF